MQLSILRKAGVVISVKKGRQVYYSIHAEQIEYFNAIVLKIVDNHGCFYNSSVYISHNLFLPIVFYNIFYTKGRGSGAREFYDENGFTVLQGSIIASTIVYP